MLRFGISLIFLIFLTSACSGVNNFAPMRFSKKLPPRVDKQVIKERFDDLPFGSPEEIKIALFLPLSGKYQKLGKSLYDAAQLALFDHGDPRIVIYPFDTKASDFHALSLMDQVIEQDIKIIVGPVFSKIVQSIAPIAKENGVTIFSFSNNPNVAEQNIYVTGLDVRQQVQRVVDYTMSQDIKYFSAILPGNDYGSQVVNELRKVVEINDGMVLKTEFYIPGKNIAKNVRRVVTSLNEVPVDDNGEPIFKEIIDGEPIPLDEEGNPLYKDIEEFKTALLVVDSAKLEEVATLLAGNSEYRAETKIIGLSQFDNNPILSHKIYQDAWYVDIPKDNFVNYQAHFENTYNQDATRISSLAYDVISVISALTTRNVPLSAVDSPVGFSGVNGVFRFRDSGFVERLLEIYEVREGNSQTIEPAKFQFEQE